MTAPDRSLQRRLLRLMLTWIAFTLAAVSIVSALAFRALRTDAEHQRLALARAVAVAVDTELGDAALRLARLSRRLPTAVDPLGRVLREFRVHDRFRDAIALVGDDDALIAVEPARRREAFVSLLGTNDPAHPVRFATPPGAAPLIVLEHQFRNGAERRRLLATVDARDSMLGAMLADLIASGERHAAIVDAHGRVVASTHPEHVGLPMSRAAEIAAGLERTEPTLWRAADSPICADDPQPLLSILVPLRRAAWGLLVQEHENTAFGTSRRLRVVFLLVGGVLAAVTGLLALAVSRSIVEPIDALSRAAAQMSDGDLDTPVDSPTGDRELATLAAALETMRRRLGGTLGELERLNRDLETRVTERTRQLAERDAERRRLVGRLLEAGEEERCRIARELHDETAQLLTAIRLALDGVDERSPALEKADTMLADTQREIHRLIHDLRPSLLDDLGMPAAIRSHAGARLAGAGLEMQLTIDELPPRDPAIDTALFRVFQELATNIVRHADAARVGIELYAVGDRLRLIVEDDGRGFDPEAQRSGVGITGIRERLELVGGSIRIDSEPGMGTHVVVEVPFKR